MSFAAPSDVSAYFPEIPVFLDGSDATEPSLAEITAWISQDQAIMKSKLSAIVNFDNTTTDGDLILKQINAKMTACKVDNAMPYLNSKSQEEEKLKRNLCKEASEMMSDILAGRLEISTPCQDAFANLIASQIYPENKFNKDTRY